MEMFKSILSIIACLVVIAGVGSCSVVMMKEGVSNHQRLQKMCDTEWDKPMNQIPVNVLRECEKHYGKGSGVAPGCNLTVEQLNGLKDWPMKCEDYREYKEDTND